MIRTDHPDEFGLNLGSSAKEAVAAMQVLHHRVSATTTPAPVVTELIDELKPMWHWLPGVLEQLGHGLVRSLREDDVYESDDSDPVTNVLGALAHLRTAAQHARELSEALEHVQSAIHRQGYRSFAPARSS